jgi:hypothetical protein
MTEFVLNMQGNTLSSELGLKAINYANFLSQPLKLGMFVPCVDNVPLEEPNHYYLFESDKLSRLDYTVCEDEYQSFIQYQQAKENVLFEGFEYGGHSKECFILEYKDGAYWLNSNDTIEGLIENFTESLTLTDSAINKLKQQ